MKSALRQALITILIVLIIFAVMRTTLHSYTVEGTSMEPSFSKGQYLLVNKVSYHFRSPQRGDVIIFQPPAPSHGPYIKRIIGLPGERVEIKEGKVYIYGRELKETINGKKLEQIPYSDNCSVTLSADQYFVLGDNRPHSTDSRKWGPVAKENIIGKAWLCYWPPGDWGLSPSYSATMDKTER